MADPTSGNVAPPSFRGGRDGSRGAIVYEAVKTAIRDGAIRAGQRLREREVAHWLGVSRTPVREAFKMLLAQGILSEASGDGLLVTTLSPQEVAELYEAWADMEAMAARYAARNASDADIATLEDVCARWKRGLPPQELSRLNREFHSAIHAATDNRYLCRALDSIDDALALLGVSTYTIPGRPTEAGREHVAVAKAIAARDPEAAYAAAYTHIQRAGVLRASLFREHGVRRGEASDKLRRRYVPTS